MNRLSLDFSLETPESRQNFIEKYLTQKQFQIKPPTNAELELMGNYILWGEKSKNYKIKTKYDTWGNEKTESLDALLENPKFNEETLFQITDLPIKVKKEVFNRETALLMTSDRPYLYNTFKKLYAEIDFLELTLNYYDILKGKREKPPRQELLNSHTKTEITTAQNNAAKMNTLEYSKQRHYLVELRRQQYTLRDSIAQKLLKVGTPLLIKPSLPNFGTEIKVEPLGLYANSHLFLPLNEFFPANFNKKEVQNLIKEFWRRKDQAGTYTIDFKNLEHVYRIILNYSILEDAAMDKGSENNTSQFLETLNYYIAEAQLDEIKSKILYFKMRGFENAAIAEYINSHYGKSYSRSYISTIFRQKIIVAINAAAALHEELILQLPAPENFKTCIRCGNTFLRKADYFTRKKSMTDGFVSKCKKCEKEVKEEKKNKK